MHSFDRGCPQGSVLGPILFNMYVRDVTSDVKSEMVSYADDSYVICAGVDSNEVMETLVQNVKSHTAYLTKLGMVVHNKKTEIIHFCKPKEEKIAEVNSDGKTMATVEKLKVLGVILDANLNWKEHIKSILSRVKALQQGLRILRKKFNMKETICLITSQVMSVLYYGSQALLGIAKIRNKEN